MPQPLQLAACAARIGCLDPSTVQIFGYYTEAGYDVDFVVARGGADAAKQVGAGKRGQRRDRRHADHRPRQRRAGEGRGAAGWRRLTAGRRRDANQRPEDLKGKTVTVIAYQDTTYYALLGMLANGLTKNDINAQAVGPAGVASLVVAGTVDACACTPDWEIDVKEGVKDTVSLPTRDYFQSMSQAILASDKMIAERPDLVRAIVKATLQGMKFVMD